MRHHFLFGLALVFLGAAPAAAAEVSLSVQAFAWISGGTLNTRVRVINSGKSALVRVRVLLHLPDGRISLGGVRRLGAGYSFETMHKQSSEAYSRGHYACIAEVFFHDAGNMPHSTLAGGVFTVGHPPQVELEAHAADVDIFGEAIFNVDLKARMRPRGPVAATLYLPAGLMAGRRRQMIIPDGRGIARAAFTLSDPGQYTDGRYPLFCVLSYEQEGIVQSELVAAQARLHAYEPIWRRRRGLVFGAGGFVLAGGWASLAASRLLRRLRARGDNASR